jgi:hemerythrin
MARSLTLAISDTIARHRSQGYCMNDRCQLDEPIRMAEILKSKQTYLEEPVMAKEWTQDMAVGVAEIDSQHKALFEHVNRLVEAMSRGEAMKEISQTLDFLARYAQSHFATEEQYMTQYGYPSLETHRLQHRAFVREFGTWMAEFQGKGASVALVLDVHHRVTDWLVNHISKTDKLLGKFLQSRVVGAAAE